MIFLQDLLTAQDLGQAAGDLIGELRTQHDLPPVYQLGLVAPDVEAAAHQLESQGFGPFFIAHGSPVLWLERGQARQIRGKLGLAYHQGLELELLEPGEGTDFYRQSLDPAGRVVVQHLGFLVPDVDAEVDRLVATGLPLWVRGRLSIGPVKVDFAYLDTLEQAGLIVELIRWHALGQTFKPPAPLLGALGRLEKRSGKRSIPL